jgi:mono/diheme cytochrome c family protein
MRSESWILAGALCVALSAAVSAQWGDGWTIPADAEREKSPVTSSADVVKRGRGIFERSCQKCHGPEGKGDGPNSDPRHQAADLTSGSLLDQNPDGVLFYRIWNGKPPNMPAFKSQLSRDEIWTAVEYVKSLPPKP